VTASPAVSIAGVPIRACELTTAATAIIDAARDRRHLSVHLLNAYVLALASRNAGYSRLLARGDLNLADGAPVAWFAARAGAAIRTRPSGAELVEEVSRRGRGFGVRHYLYGSTPAVADGLATVLRDRHPGIELAGVESPPFGPVTAQQAESLALAATATDAHIIWIGLGTPKQDELVDLLRGRFDGPCVPVGAAFDFLAGSVPRAPRWMRRAGLEWMYRLLREPKRLWRRYLWGNAQFVWALARTGRVLHGSGGWTA
jgi:N-acetylglucosaminyldiphosphoundecaprenol N-acetyl-beta-D-mannosaminyltransferase